MSRDPEKLTIFEVAHQLAVDVYALTRGFPDEERFGLSAQLRRAAVSVPTNIVEGCARSSARDFARFLEMARSSAVEVRYLLKLSTAVGALDPNAAADCRMRVEHVARALHKLQRSVLSFDTET